MPDNDKKLKSLIRLNEELENYFRNTIIPQLFVDRDLILRKFSPPAMKQFKLKPDDIGKKILDVKDNFRFPAILDDIKHVIEFNDILEKEIQTTDYRWYQMNILPYFVGNTKSTNGVIITFVEITARIEDLKNYENLVSEYETLLATISHDIKNPLTSILLTINHLKKTSDDQSKSFLGLFGILENSVTKMQSIINELTDTERLRNKFQGEEELLDFENILEDVRLTLAGTIIQSGTQITSQINVSEILFSRRKLRSVVYNLVSNAIKYQPAGQKPIILVKTERQDNNLIITVKDNGLGIDPSKHDTIFAKYHRIDQSIEGSGVGLYLVNEIVTSYGGKIVLKSELGKGAEFRIDLPDKMPVSKFN